MIIDPAVRTCEITLRRALQEIQTASDGARLAQFYEDAKNSLATLLTRDEIRRDTDTQRDLISLMLYVHLAYRTKEADCAQASRILAVR